jgi:hypothetical protein
MAADGPPKRPASPFILFVTKHRAGTDTTGPDGLEKSREATKLATAAWKVLTDHEKQVRLYRSLSSVGLRRSLGIHGRVQRGNEEVPR